MQFAYRILVGCTEECFSQVIYRAFGLCCCERTEIAKVKTDENEKNKNDKRCAVSTGVVAAMPL